MAFFQPPQIEEFIKKSNSEQGKRNYSRLAVSIPVYYGFPLSDEDTVTDFNKCRTLNISSGGLVLDLISPDNSVVDKIQIPRQRVILKIDIPKESKQIKIVSNIVRTDTAKNGSKIKYLTAVQFRELELNDRISLISHSIRQARKKTYYKIGIIFAVLCVVAISTWGVRFFLTEQPAPEEVTRQEVPFEDINAKALKAKMRIEEIENRFYDEFISSNTEIITIQNTEDTKASMSPYFTKGCDAYKAGDYKKALALFQKISKKNKKSAVVYNFLARTYSKLKKEKESREAFKKYLELVEE